MALLQPPPPPPPPSAAVVSVPFAIAIGLLCSFVQSLGLTVQRKSHLLAARQPEELRKSEWRQPLWLLGFVIFIVANVGGTIFQIGALPIVMLAPLGAVSLLYNALLAKFLLHDILGRMMIGGTALILMGAVLIGYFGAIQEPPHSLEQLMALFGRSPFIALSTILLMSLICVLAIAHLAEWSLYVHAQAIARGEQPVKRSKSKKSGHKKHSKLARRWSAPSLAPLDEVSETTSGVATPVLEIRDRERQMGFEVASAANSLGVRAQQGKRKSPVVQSYGTLPSRRGSHNLSVQPPRLSRTSPDEPNEYDAAVLARTKLLLAVAYAAVSGTLSGVCLLLAKSGVELLVLTFAGHSNQFNRVGSWALLAVMILAALAQLWYLNKALRMADPTLVCPLAFCFYNTSSIALGLVYFDQVSSISPASLTLVIVGIVVLLAGVFIVSMKPASATELIELPQEGQNAECLVSSPTAMNDSPTETQALLASNAGGITGPHLPPPVTSASESSAEPAPRRSPSTPPAKPRSRSASHGSRSGSISNGQLAGLGLHLPDYHSNRNSPTHESNPLSPKRTSPNRSQQAPETTSQSNAGAPPTITTTEPPLPTSPSQELAHRRSPSLYQSILNRGLSIGLSPSSPGFHIGVFASPIDDEEEDVDAQSARDLARFQRMRGPRRVYSEADAGGLAVGNNVLQRASQSGELSTDTAGGQDADSSAFRFQIPALDAAAISDRLSNVRQRWVQGSLGGLRKWWARNVYGHEDWREHERRRLLEDAV